MPGARSKGRLLSTSLHPLEKARDCVVEEPVEILRLLVAADGERQHDCVDLRALGDPLRRAVTLVSRAYHHLRRLALQDREHLREVCHRWLDAGLRLERRDLVELEPGDEIGE